MYINNLKLINFRNYDSLNIEFSPNINFLTGNNGAGKTNIIESISLLSNLKSFKTIQDTDIVKWKKNSYYCSGTISDSEFSKFEVGFSYDENIKKKRYKIDSNEIKKASEYYGKLLSVFFLPEDINIINGSPDIKRRYFDSVISKVYPEYINILNDFKNILNSRNKLLKQIRESRLNSKSLDIWSKLFSERYAVIFNKRKEFINEFNSIFCTVYTEISGENILPFINYKTDISYSEPDKIYEILVSKQNYDIKRGQCCFGPHRDIYTFSDMNNIEFKQFASQGQRRTAAIALKAAEFELIYKLTNKKSIILIDDIFSELDSNRRRNMIYFFKNKSQLIFTMVNSDIIDLAILDNYKNFRISNCSIFEGN